MNYIITYLLLAMLVCLGVMAPKSKGVKVMVISMVFIIMAFSQDTGDFFVYEREYSKIIGGGTSTYEVMFVLTMQIGKWLGLTYLQYRRLLTLIVLIVLNRFISKKTVNATYVWTLYLICSTVYDGQLLRHFLAMTFALPALWMIIEKNGQYKVREVIKYLLLVSLAGLSHSSFWLFLGFLPLSFVKNRTKVIFITVGTIVVFLGSATDIIQSVYSLLPVREYTIGKYFSGSYANLNGLIFDCIAQVLYILPSVLGWYVFSKRKLSLAWKNTPIDTREQLERDIYVWLCFNILFCVLVPFQLMAVNFSRMQRLLAIINYIFIGRFMSTFKGRVRMFQICGLVYAVTLLAFTMLIQSNTNIEYVWIPIFESNPFLNFFKW